MNTDNPETNSFCQRNKAQDCTNAQTEYLFPEQTPKKDPPCNMILNILGNGMVGSITILMSLLIPVSENLLIGNIPNSTTYLVAKENTNIVMRLIFYMFCYSNIGLLICISRCLGIKDYKGVDHFNKMNFRILSVALLITVAVLSLYAWLCGYWYESENLRWTRI